jgi:hypothetical protein
VAGGGEDAGNITLDALFVILDGSQIIANAFEGMGGNIRIGADVFLADPASRVEASSALGIQGTVDIQTPVTSLGGTLAPLPQAFVNVAALLPARCAARAQGAHTAVWSWAGGMASPSTLIACCRVPSCSTPGWERTRQGLGSPVGRSPRIGLRSCPARTRSLRGCGGRSTWKVTGGLGPGGAPSDGGQGYIFQAYEGI